MGVLLRPGLAAAGVLAAAACLATACVEERRLLGDGDRLCDTSYAITLDPQSGHGLPDKTIALTFDDGPAERTEELSAYLRDQGIQATFFVNGMWVKGQEPKLATLVDHGHLVGNHTESHLALTKLRADEVVTELERTDAVLGPLVPSDKLFFRPPFGAWDDKVHAAIAVSPMSKYKGPVGWDIGDRLTATSAADWDCWDEANGVRTVEQCGDLYLREIRDKRRGVVLMHDGPPFSPNPKTVDMVKYVVPILKAEGYAFVRIDAVPLRGFPVPEAGAPEPPPDAPPADAGPRGPATDPCRATDRP